MIDLRQVQIKSISVEDIRFRFPRLGHGSDAINPHTDYSNPLVTVRSSSGDGIGIGFSLGKGNDMICQAVEELSELVVGRTLEELLFQFGTFKWILSNPVQSRWIAPNGGPYYMAGGAIMNALFDLWAKIQGMPLWQAIIDLEPEELVSMIDFRYIEHLLTRDEALSILSANVSQKSAHSKTLVESGLPAYFTTWIGTGTEELVDQIRSVKTERGIRGFKLKVGSELRHDIERLTAIRSEFGDTIDVYTDANQVWSAEAAITWMHELASFDIRWIEEPTAPDSISGHRHIRNGLRKDGIHVVTGENCPNPQIAAEFIATGAVDRYQIDACRMMGPTDVLLVMLVAKKYNVPICPHAGGSGLDELVPHLAAWNYASCSPDLENVVVEQVGFCSDFFDQPSVVKNGRIQMPKEPGYLVGMKDDAIRKYRFPDGTAWR